MTPAKLRSWILGLFGRRRVEQEMSQEIRFHIEARAGDLLAQGLGRDEARRQARLEFGSVEKYEEEMRGSRGLGLWDELRGDLLYGLRSLRRNRSFTAVATISFALGIG